MLDLAIIGSGPAALTAGLYAARAGLSVKIYEKNRYGGALPDISHLANFPGFDGKGKDFADKLISQVKNAGVELSYGLCSSVDPLIIDGEEVLCRAVLVATGSEPRQLSLPTSKTISYCVLCDGDLYKEKNVLVIGGGNSAIGESISLSKIAKTVTIVSHSPLKAQDALINELKRAKNVAIYENTDPRTVNFDQFDGIFVLIGKVPATRFMPEGTIDADGYIMTDEKYLSKISPVFAAGDVRAGSMKQAISASAEGAAAANAIIKFLK